MNKFKDKSIKQIGKMFKMRRIELDYSMQDVADKIGKTASYILYIEKGTWITVITMAFKSLCDLYGFDYEQCASRILEIKNREDAEKIRGMK